MHPRRCGSHKQVLRLLAGSRLRPIRPDMDRERDEYNKTHTLGGSRISLPCALCLLPSKQSLRKHSTALLPEWETPLFPSVWSSPCRPPPLTWLGPLRDLDLKLVSVGQVVCGHSKAAAGDLGERTRWRWSGGLTGATRYPSFFRLLLSPCVLVACSFLWVLLPAPRFHGV